jgi:cob(I)alamin adenosyltransferase
LNSSVGTLLAFSASNSVKEALTLVQHDLFDLGAQLSGPGTPLLSRAHLSRLEENVEQMNSNLGLLKEFILPGGAPASAFAHVARTVCRRAERRLLTMVATEAGEEGKRDTTALENFGLSYLNRLSDLLFVVSRVENHAAGKSDTLWQRGKSLESESRP